MLLKDKKHHLFLLSIHEYRVLDLKTLHAPLGARGRLGFAPAERMIELLGVMPSGQAPYRIIAARARPLNAESELR